MIGSGSFAARSLNRGRTEALGETPQRHRRAVLYALLAGLALAPLLLLGGVLRLGHWLIVEDRLGPARAIVVLGGQVPFRAMEAARTYRRGLAPEVWLTRGGGDREQNAFRRLGILYIPEEAYNRRVLERMGVPARSIRVLEEEAENTAEELLLVSKELRKVGGSRVILITSKPHTRRVKIIWRALVGSTPQAEVRYVPEDPFDPSGWWKSTEGALDVSREFFGLVNAWAGFPVRPSRNR
jgi:uncharacterized SAM-binding protein YcdF (DUF218 family)